MIHTQKQHTAPRTTTKGHRPTASKVSEPGRAAAADAPTRLIGRMMDKQIRLARTEEDGAAGEREIIPYLKKLPDTYTVVSDLDFADSYGNIDHLVIGPTGIFSIDVKNWKGTVSSDGKGELLQNGRPTDKPHVRPFTARTMDLKDRLKVLTRLDPFIQCVFVFPHTHLNANWGTTGYVHCIHADQIEDYITKGKGSKPIAPADIPRLVAAAKALKETITSKTPASAPSPAK
jgi:hypothetical protein